MPGGGRLVRLAGLGVVREVGKGGVGTRVGGKGGVGTRVGGRGGVGTRGGGMGDVGGVGDAGGRGGVVGGRVACPSNSCLYLDGESRIILFISLIAELGPAS